MATKREEYMHSRNTMHGEYIPSIDGLRAIAVILVILFHLDLAWLKGGFVGVDVFFVISGFLITKNMLSDIGRQEFSFSQFYLRRIARLLPALFVTLACTLIVAYWVLGPEDLARLGRVAILTVVSTSNIFFWFESDYFDTSTAFKPLLHTWSLAVEEQFYLFWPLLVWYSVVSLGKRFAFAILAILGVFSLAAAVVYAKDHSSAVFYLAPFRTHQFVIGAILAFTGLGPRNRMSSVVSAVSVLVLLGIAGSAVSGEHAYLYTAFTPALVAGALIWSSHSSFSSRVLASRAAEWIGKRSYSMYLVHWPLIVLWKMATDLSLSYGEKFVALLVTFMSGAILYEHVERRFRFHRGQSLHQRSAVLAGVMALGVALLLAGSHYWGLQGIPGRIPAELREVAGDIQTQWNVRQRELRDGVCNFKIHTFKANEYDRGRCSKPPLEKKSYLIIGDSFASDAYLVMTRAFPEIYFGQVTIPGCQLRMPKRFNENSPCRELFDIALSELAFEGNYDGVVLASNWLDGHYYRIDDLLKYFNERGLEIILIGQHIRFADRLPSIVTSSMSREDAIRKAQGLILDEQFKINKTIKERFSKRAKFIDFMMLQCTPDCDIFDSDGHLLYLDDSHVSLAGAEFIARQMRADYPEIAVKWQVKERRVHVERQPHGAVGSNAVMSSQ